MAGAPRLNRAAAQAVHLDRRVMAVEVGVEQCDVEILALAGALAMQQRRHHRQRRVYAGAHVAERRGRKVGWPIRFADHVGNPGIRLRDEVVAGQMRERALLAEGRNRAHHDARVERPRGFVVQAHPRDHAGREILHHHVDLGHEFLENRERVRIFDVEAEAALAEVLLDEVAAAMIAVKRQHASAVAVGRDLHFDNIGAHLRHHPGDGGSGDELGEVEDFVAVEYVGRVDSTLMQCPGA